MKRCHKLLLHFIKRYLCFCITRFCTCVLLGWSTLIFVHSDARPCPQIANVIVGPPWLNFCHVGRFQNLRFLIGYKFGIAIPSYRLYTMEFMNAILKTCSITFTIIDEGVVCTVQFFPLFVSPLITLLTWSQSGQSTKTTLSRWQSWFAASSDFLFPFLWSIATSQ